MFVMIMIIALYSIWSLPRQGGPGLSEWARSVFPHWNIKDDSYHGLIRILVLPKKDM
jgi:hypothetical protein